MVEVCLVTGGAGFIGCAISEKLTRLFDRVIAVDNLHPQIHRTRTRPDALHPGVELAVGDVTEPATWQRILTEVSPSVIVHLAAETGTGQSLTEATRHAHVNVVGTTRMTEALAEFAILPRKIILSSSRAVYGEGAWHDRTRDALVYPGQRSKAQFERAEWDFSGLTPAPAEATRTHPNPTSIYGATKLTQEHILQSWGLSVGVDIGVLRLQNVYGPGQSLINSYTGIVPLFARLARQGRSIPVYEDGDIVRDFVFIDDVVDAILRVVGGAFSDRHPYDIGSGVATSIYDLACKVAALYEAPAPHINGMFRNGDVRYAACDIARTTDELGWEPRWSINAGVATLCRWIDARVTDDHLADAA